MDTDLVLVIEDEDDIRELVAYNLSKEGYRVIAVATGEEGIAVAEAKYPHAVLLDLMLPGVDGLTVCRRIKGNPRTEQIPIIMLTAKGEEADIVSGFNLGADDYITKPFSPRVLVARLRAVLRRRMSAGELEDGDSPVEYHGLKIHPGRHEVSVDGQPVELTSTEFRVLHFLARRPGWVFTRQQILDGVHGDNYAITERAVDVHVVGLRKKLGSAGEYIETVRGVGYRFKE
ncbi:MAG: response regulator [Thermoguttaceae bacterium]|nr:response regulator [Thermoguttaceae bacterium]